MPAYGESVTVDAAGLRPRLSWAQGRPGVVRADRRGSTVFASLTTQLTGTNNDVVYTAVAAGWIGAQVSVAYVVAGVNTPLSVSVSGLAITVAIATDGTGAPTSTAAQVKAAIEASGAASALVAVALAPGNNGSGVVTAMPATFLGFAKRTADSKRLMVRVTPAGGQRRPWSFALAEVT